MVSGEGFLNKTNPMIWTLGMGPMPLFEILRVSEKYQSGLGGLNEIQPCGSQKPLNDIEIPDFRWMNIIEHP